MRAEKGAAMVGSVFAAHGRLCASRPWEVMIGMITFTSSIMSIGWLANTKRQICGWNYKCDLQNDDVQSSDVLILAIIRCLAVIYIYLQFTNLRKLGSKYLLGISCLFTIFSSFMFSFVVIHLSGSDLTGLNEALPFFLLLVDLSKAAALAKYALSSSSQTEVVENISRGMSKIGPALSLDTLVEALVIGVGTLSGVKRLETMCCFGCLSVLANYLAFMTFYPACLALILELFVQPRSRPLVAWRKSLVQLLDGEHEDAKPNPVTQRVKVIMSAGLVLIHVHKRWMVEQTMDANHYPGLEVMGQATLASNHINPTEPLWFFYLKQAFSPSIDYSITLGLAVFLGIKYILYDKEHVEMDAEGTEDTEEDSMDTKTARFSICDTDSDSDEVTNSIEENAKLNGMSPSIAHRCMENALVNRHPTVRNDQRPNIQSNSSPPPSEPINQYVSTVQTSNGNKINAALSTVIESKEDEETETETKSTRALVPKSSAGPLQDLVAILKTVDGAQQLSDEDVLTLVKAKHIPAYKLEAMLGDHERGVAVRRNLVTESLPNDAVLENLPYEHYNYKYVEGACCENVIGYMPIPVGVAGPLPLDGRNFMVPMATTEGCLVASTNRGCRALSACEEGVRSEVVKDGMSRAPLVRFPSVQQASQAKRWIEEPENYAKVAESFSQTSRFARLLGVEVTQASRNLFLRFVAKTGDAMGMNMLSKGSERAVLFIQEQFPNMEILSLSGNMCTDKKPAAINWIRGRGKYVVCDAVIPRRVIESVLKTSAAALVDLNHNKNMMGSAMAGSIGGFNAHAANVVAAIFIATGQDPAQTVCSSMCLTVMEAMGDGDLYLSCTMPSIEVGTVGGGTVLPPQASALKMLGVHGSCASSPGEHAARLARIVCGTVMAGELSLMSALAAGHLVKSHLRHNRSTINLEPGTCTTKSP